MIALLLAAAAGLVPAAQASAEVLYPAPSSLASAGGEVRQLEAAIDRSGAATVVWHERDGGIERVRARRIGADGTPVAPERTVRTGQSGDSISPPRIAIAPDGVAAVVWAIEREIQGDTVVQAQRISADGSLNGPRIDLAGEGAEAESPDVAVDGEGRATVAWVEPDESEARVRVVRIPATGSPGPTRVLSPPGEVARSPRTAVDDLGRVTVAWPIEDEGSRVQAVRLRADGNPGPRHDLSAAGHPVTGIDVSVDGRNRALVVWLQGESHIASVRLRRIAANGNPVGSVRHLSQRGAVEAPSLAVDASGWAAVSWSQVSAFEPNIQLRRIAPDGTIGRERDVTVDRADSFNPVPAIDPEGRAILAWVDATAGHSRIQALRTGPDGSFGPIRTVSTSSAARDPAVIVDGDGVPTALWSARSGASELVRLSRGEIVGPFTTLIGEPEQGDVINEPFPTFNFRAITSDPLGTVADFECRLGTGQPFSCSPGEQIGPLANGAHVFGVRAIDIEGDWGPPAARGFRAIVTNLPSKLTIDRARIVGGHPANRRLAVTGSLDDRAARRPVFFTYRTAAGQIRARTRVNRQGRFRLVQPLRGGPARAGGGRLAVAFRGSRELRSGRAAIRVGQGRLSLRLGHPRMQGNRLLLAGRLTPRLAGPLRARLELNRPNAAPMAIRLQAPVNRRGVFRIDRRVPGWVSVAGGYVTVAHPGRGRFSGRVAGVTLKP